MTRSLATHQVNPYSKVYPGAHIKAMEDVIKIPSGPRRWRASAAIWFNLNKLQPESGLSAQKEYVAVCKMVKDMRGQLKNKFAELMSTDTATDSGVRHGLEIPAGMWAYIKMFDKPAFEASNPNASKNMRLLMKEFPELTVAEKI